VYDLYKENYKPLKKYQGRIQKVERSPVLMALWNPNSRKWPSSNTSPTAVVGEDMEKKEPSYTAGGNAS
jgi:hypothetical protein